MQKLLAIVAVLLLFPLTVLADSNHPNQTENHPNQTEPPESGWGEWRPSSETTQADYAGGFSNMELGGFLDFQAACAQSLKLPMDTVPYWFRLSDLVAQIGTGQVEYGCIVQGNITNSLRITAIKRSLESVTCLRVASMDGKALPVYVEPNQNSNRIRRLPNGSTVNPGSFPALIEQNKGQNWVAIVAPVRGWVVQGAPGSRGNLRLCSSRPRSLNP